MNSLSNLVGLILLGALFYLLGIGVIIVAGLILHGLFFDHPEGLMLVAMVIWTLLCLAVALRGAYRMLARGF
ncbi:hypothetical protein [Paraburkholderia sp. GAS82]|uniref:hypothetical protein n=1 Tax=Paraburkholderia sp. GAS82 TaxID=3035137 RepID=UPI003D1B248F